MVEWLHEKGDISDEAAGKRRLQHLQRKMNETRRCASEETRSYVLEEITVEEDEDSIPGPLH